MTNAASERTRDAGREAIRAVAIGADKARKGSWLGASQCLHQESTSIETYRHGLR